MKIEFERFDHVMLCIPIGAEEQARHFYGTILGLTELTEQSLGFPLPKRAIWFQMGNVQLHMRAEGEQQLSERHPAFQIKNLEEAEQLLTSHGISVKHESKIPGRIRFSFRDPFNNRIELIEMI